MIVAPPLTGRRRWLVLLLVLAFGLLLFVWQLGTTGLVDETPPLFAASARGMVERGQWLVPQVNGLPRYDKPPLVYWLMGLLYALPGQEHWNPLGTWAAGAPSALASVVVMLALADTLLRWPQPERGGSAAMALSAALAFALSPLVLLWGRIPVSDGLFSGLVALALLSAWRRWADPGQPWWTAWLLLGLAVLTKGPVALLLCGLTLLLFGWLQGEPLALLLRLRPRAGLLLTALVALPWYALTLLQEGRSFWDSFFGYHNLQRFTVVVNHHLQPWWFFGPVLVVASLPVTPLLLLGLVRAVGPLTASLRRPALPLRPAASLARFAACWLLAILLFFTCAATKLPSYWLPATPAAALLVALAASSPDRAARRAWLASLLLAALLGVVFALAPLWVPLISDPELPSLPADLLASGLLVRAACCWLAAAFVGLLLRGRLSRRLLALQLPLVAFVPLVLLPAWALGDRLRGEPVRAMAAALRRQAGPGEPLAMVGILKPSLHYYSGRVVIYEGNRPEGARNLADRLRRERRPGQPPSSPEQQPTLLMVIDGRTAALPFWQGLAPRQLAQAGLYRLWRLDRRRLEQRAAELARSGVPLTWNLPRPERY
ncbi:MAG: glycosyltransferase family 39 protein [Synechococcaceae cyanobacterium]|nr:glycosyltransferase family 39 protein [Synechococcaceae cyanobacterium]